MLTNYLKVIKNLFLPRLCFCCEKKISKGYLCLDCEEKITFLSSTGCRHCLKPLNIDSITLCRGCLKKPTPTKDLSAPQPIKSLW